MYLDPERSSVDYFDILGSSVSNDILNIKDNNL